MKQLHAERKKNIQYKQDIQRLKKKSAYEKKYRSLKVDFDHLLA